MIWPPFFKWFDYIEKNHIVANELTVAIKHINKLDMLGKKVEIFKNEIK